MRKYAKSATEIAEEQQWQKELRERKAQEKRRLELRNAYKAELGQLEAALHRLGQNLLDGKFKEISESIPASHKEAIATAERCLRRVRNDITSRRR